MELKLVKNEEKYFEFIRQLRNDEENQKGFLEKSLITSEQQINYMLKQINLEELFPTMQIKNSTELKFDFDDILIEPAITTEISSRSTISITYHYEYRLSTYEHLPLITAPMDTVVSKENRDHFISNNLNICYPRGIETNRYNINGKMCFVSYSLNDFISKFIDTYYDFKDNQEINICIDTANGHIDTLKTSIQVAKEKYGKRLIIMAGNVANPYSYVELSKAGCNFVRLGIGNGNGCLTTQQTAI